MRYLLASFLVLLAVWPRVSEAGVIFSEVAWMGDSVSANNEWIEIYNDSDSSVNLDGYTITDTGTLNIVLAGTLPARAYGLLERNRSSGAYLATPPFFTYSGALVNTGTTLRLSDQNGTLLDQVAGGENWVSIGGDNATKDTAQYTTSGWITASPTPGAPNRTTGTPPVTTPTTTSTTTNTSGGTSSSGSNTTSNKSTSKSSQTVRLGSRETTLTLALDVQDIAYVNQPVAMAVTPGGLGDGVLPSIDYEWNFGDLSTSRRRTPTHAYTHPGTYVITVYATVGEKTQIARHDITILPVTLTMERLPDGALSIYNNAPYDVDISGYTLGTLTIPPRTVMAPRSAITVPKERVPDGTQLVLRDTGGQVVAVWPTYPEPEPEPELLVTATDFSDDIAAEPLLYSVATTPVTPVEATTFTPLVLKPATRVATSTMPEWVLQAVTPKPPTEPETAPLWPYAALALLIMGAGAVIIASQKKLGSSEPEITTATPLYTAPRPRDPFPFS